MTETNTPATPTSKPRGMPPWGLVWLLVWLLPLELAARRFWTPEFIEPELYSKIDPSYGYGYEYLRPPCEPDGEQLRCRPTQYRTIVEQTFDLTKRADALRVFTVGGSHAWGFRAYTQQLGQLLAVRCPTIHWETINFAVAGQGSRRARLAAAEHARYAPDLWIVDFGGSNEYEDERDFAYREELHEGIGLVILRSHAVVLARKLLMKKLPLATVASKGHETIASRDLDNQARWRESLRTNYQALIDDAHAQGITVVLVGRASLKPHEPNSREQADYAVFEQLAAQPNVISLDTHALFQTTLDKTARARLFREDRNHYSRAGHRRIAQALAELLLAELPRASECPAPSKPQAEPGGRSGPKILRKNP
jgi:lysophospholipase L1-like esterase